MAKVKHFLKLNDLNIDELSYLFERAAIIKARYKSYKKTWTLEDRTLVMIFEKASTRTRLSFEAGMNQMGGSAVYLNTRDSQLGRGEPVEDAAQVISRMSDIVMIRTFEQDIIERFAKNSRVPVINGLTNEFHPCQILADIFTFIEKRGEIKGKKVAWIGDSNNVCMTWLQAAELLGFELHVSTPKGYEVQLDDIDNKNYFFQHEDPMEAAKDADIVTTDVWTSMGFESENKERLKDFASWQVDKKMMGVAKKDALFMHCLPAHREEEVSGEVIDGPQSIVWEEAENRLHIQKSIIRVFVNRKTINMIKDVKKIVLAYSGGLDTSVILKWLQDQYDCEVVTFTADLGQKEEIEPARAKAQSAGVKEIFIEDLREEFVRDYVFPMFRANALYEGEYLLGTSIARPLISKRLVEIAHQTGSNAISHGATGKGNDQVRFELGAYAIDPDIKIIAPWREWDLLSREKLLKYATENNIPVEMKHKSGGTPYSMDANLLHISYEGRHLEDPKNEPEESMWRWSVDPKNAPDKAQEITIGFENGDPNSLNGKKLLPHEILEQLNILGGDNGIGRLDLVENRYVGMKARGCYETPGGTILLKAHRAIESLTLDREVAHLKDELMPRYASLIYNGYWWSPERIALQALIDHTQKNVNGWVKLNLYKGNVILVARDSKHSLFDPEVATFEDDDGAFDHQDAAGFIKLNALRLRLNKKRK